MRITSKMVETACGYYLSEHNHAMNPAGMRKALEASVGHVAVSSDNRWDAFSDEEVDELLCGAHERSHKTALPKELILRATKLRIELTNERRRREGGYQGPGVYRSPSGEELFVLGDFASTVDGTLASFVVHRDVRDKSGVCGSRLEDFNAALEGAPRYHYLRPLEA